VLFIANFFGLPDYSLNMPLCAGSQIAECSLQTEDRPHNRSMNHSLVVTLYWTNGACKNDLRAYLTVGTLS
jgi:hypothetical protein